MKRGWEEGDGWVESNLVKPAYPAFKSRSLSTSCSGTTSLSPTAGDLERDHSLPVGARGISPLMVELFGIGNSSPMSTRL